MKFGELIAINNLNLNIKKGEIRGIIGPNGSGKTTLLNVINGIHDIDRGSVKLNGEQIDNLNPHEITKKGIGRTFQVLKVWRDMTVIENLIVPAITMEINISIPNAKKKALEIANFLNINHLKDEYAKNLSGGQQRLLEIGRALILNPILILMDEPFAGVHPNLKKQIIDLIHTMNNEKNITFIIVSHEMESIAFSCKKVSVLHLGENIAEGTMEDISNNPKVIEAYLGSEPIIT